MAARGERGGEGRVEAMVGGRTSNGGKGIEAIGGGGGGGAGGGGGGGGGGGREV